MINEILKGKVIAVTAGKKEKIKLTLESDSISYESMSKFSPSISSTLLNIQPMPFKKVNFGDMDGVYLLQLADLDCDYVSILNITVTIKENLPTYRFKLELPEEYFPGKGHLFGMKDKEIDFKFEEKKHD